ncbi:GNAT family N-acetyltransferase [Salinicoccus siamensis]|uniref:GNAT family N-acetyltransferase n=1 Tax=Salinicoccus siamensis TaxID=381830 RepID=A0ABV5Z5B7_9STAP
MWQVRSFEELDVATLEEIYRLRTSVFVVEQECPYQEVDGRDPECTHIYKKDESGIAAYLRIVPGKPIAIGRVIVRKDHRKKGLGKALMEQAMHYVGKVHPGEKVYLHGQAHLERFYQQFGFKKTSEVHLEDGIPHIDMTYQTDQA